MLLEHPPLFQKSFAAQLFLVVSMISGMVVWIAFRPSLDYLGIVCMTFNIMNFGAPLAGLVSSLRDLIDRVIV